MIVVNTTDLGRPYSVISLVDGIGHAPSAEKAKDTAIAVMIQKAMAIGADAVVNVRISYTADSMLANNFIAYGTAVKFV